MNLSHRLRLSLVASVAAGTVLAFLFSAIVVLSRRDVLGDKEAELRTVMRSFTSPSDSQFDLAEFHGAHPELAAAVYDGRGVVVRASGRFRPRKVVGFEVRKGWLTFGSPFRGENVALALDLHEVEEGLGRLDAALIALWIPLTLLVGGATWIAAQSVFRPLERLSEQALAIGGTDLGERLSTADRAEFGAFAGRLNAMLDRIQETVERGERFSVDAAHELRTPLAILRTRLETALLQPRAVDDYQRTLRRSVDEIARLTVLTESLLRSARGTFEPCPPIDLRPVALEAAGRWGERFAARNVGLRPNAASIRAAILPDEVHIVLDNLLDNALRYSPSGSTTVLELALIDGEASLLVRDQGSGLPPGLGERAFDRFVRADDSRNRASGGAGIGLSVCRQIVVGRGGRMFVGDGAGGGAEVGCRLPPVV